MVSGASQQARGASPSDEMAAVSVLPERGSDGAAEAGSEFRTRRQI